MLIRFRLAPFVLFISVFNRFYGIISALLRFSFYSELIALFAITDYRKGVSAYLKLQRPPFLPESTRLTVLSHKTRYFSY